MIGSSAPRPSLVGTDVLYVTDDDFLLVTSHNAVASQRLTIGGRLLRRDGVVVALQDPHAPNTDRTAAASVHQLTEGWLQSVTVIAVTSALIGQTFVRVDLVRGQGAGARTPIGTLIQGYVTAGQRRAWPGSPIESSLAGPGALRSVAGTDPPLNDPITETVPTGARWRIQSLSFQLVTDATAANREVAIALDDGTTIYCTSPSGFSHVASLTHRYSAAPLGAQTAPAQGTDRQILLPPLVLLAGHRLRTVTTNMQAGDAFGAPQLLVEEWLEAAA